MKTESSEITAGLDRLPTSEEVQDAVLLSNGVAECSKEGLLETICDAEGRMAASTGGCDSLELLETLGRPAS
jgi:hypothetical protein